MTKFVIFVKFVEINLYERPSNEIVSPDHYQMYLLHFRFIAIWVVL